MANVKITELTNLTDPSTTDVMPVVDVDAEVTKKVSVGEVVGKITGDVDVATDGTATISELPVSKLADGAARQLLQTDAAGTGVEWTDNVDVPGTFDVTGATTLDSTLDVTGLISANGKVSFPLGTADAPSLYPGSDTGTGIYSPGAAQLAISINGTGRLFVDENGRVGIGVDTPSERLDTDGNIQIKYSGINVDPSGSRYLIFNNTDTTLANDQPLGGISWVNNDSSSTSGQAAFIKAYTATNSGSAYLTLGTGGQNAATEHVRITSSGQLSHIGGGTSDSPAVGFNGSAPSNSLVIDSSGRLLVNTSNARESSSVIETESNDTKYQSFVGTVNSNTNATYAPHVFLNRSRGTTNGSDTIVNSGDTLGAVVFRGADGSAFKTAARIDGQVDGAPGANDMPGRLVFSVTADGASSPTEALRISNDRSITVSDGGDVVLGTTTGTKIGTATSQKIGFYNATPVVQPTAVADITTTATSGSLPTPDGSVTIADAATPTVTELLEYCVELEAKLEAALGHLRTLGLIAT